MLKHFVVLGDGIQGYWVALWLCRFLNLPQNSLSVTLILSKESSPSQGFIIEPSFLQLLGITQESFLSYVNASFHLASKYVQDKRVFFHSSGDKEILANYPLLIRNWISEPQKPFFKAFNPQLSLLEKDQVVELADNPLEYGYHFCDSSFKALLEKELQKKGCKIVKRKIKGKKHQDPYTISSLYDEENANYPLDLLINTCRQASFLFEQELCAPPFWEWHYQVPRLATDEKLPCYSTHLLNSHSRICTYELKNIKYFHFLFSSTQRAKDMQNLVETKGLLQPPNSQYKCPSFYKKESWQGNIIHLGEALGQESTHLKNFAARLLERQLRLLDRFFPKKENIKTLACYFNEKSKPLYQSYRQIGHFLSPPFTPQGWLLSYQEEVAKGMGICFEQPPGLFSPFEIDGFLYALNDFLPPKHPIFSHQDLRPHAQKLLGHIKSKYQEERLKLYTHYFYLNHFQEKPLTASTL